MCPLASVVYELYSHNKIKAMEVDIANVISAAGVLFSAWLTYNQYEKNKMADVKFEQYKKELEHQDFRRSENTAKVFGELHNILFAMKADRVYIVQPHPLGHEAFLSIQYEVTRKGITPMRPYIQSLPMSEVSVFSKQLAEELFVCYTNIDKEVRDRIVKGLLSVNGSNVVAIKRLNNANDWVGNIFVEFCDDVAVDQNLLRNVLHEAAVNIQFILPEFRKLKVK